MHRMVLFEVAILTIQPELGTVVPAFSGTQGVPAADMINEPGEKTEEQAAEEALQDVRIVKGLGSMGGDGLAGSLSIWFLSLFAGLMLLGIL